MWIKQMILGLLGISAGTMAAGGLISFITGLGVISDFADRTHTGKYILLYEDAVSVGGILGSILIIFQPNIAVLHWIVPVFGLLAGIFTGCWAMALAELLQIFPIFVRRIKLTWGIPWIILGTAIGKGVGAMIFFYGRWGK